MSKLQGRRNATPSCSSSLPNHNKTTAGRRSETASGTKRPMLGLYWFPRLRGTAALQDHHPDGKPQSIPGLCALCALVVNSPASGSDCFLSGFVGSDADRFFDHINEDLAVADLPCLGRLNDSGRRVFHHAVGENHF